MSVHQNETRQNEGRSYTALTVSPIRFVRDRWSQFKALRGRVRNIEADTREYMDCTLGICDAVKQKLGYDVGGKRVLEVGHGQMPLYLACFAHLGCEAVGIDLDVVPQGFYPRAYFSLLRTNGLQRCIKTLARELLGINRAFRKEFCRQFVLPRMPAVQLLQMNAAAMQFPDRSFDFVFSLDVLEHLSNPEAVILEIRRILRPGGAAFLRFVHYAVDNALHDLRVITRQLTERPHWPHLRDRFKHTVQQGAYVNTLRLGDWRRLFTQHIPQARVEVTLNDSLRPYLAAARADGELQEYSDEELLTDRVFVLWRMSSTQ